MSTLAIYGDAGQELVDESHPVADGPAQMAGVARPWEEAVGGAVADRLVIMRTGVVFDNDTAAHGRLSRLARFGLGGRIAAGTQWVSWIHIADFLRAVTFIREHGELDGVVHITSPEPVQNRDMMAALRRSVGRPWALPTPTPLVHLGARLMGSDPALALTGRRCVPGRLIDAGYAFDFPTFDAALVDLHNRRAGRSR